MAHCIAHGGPPMTDLIFEAQIWGSFRLTSCFGIKDYAFDVKTSDMEIDIYLFARGQWASPSICLSFSYFICKMELSMAAVLSHRTRENMK